MKAFEIGAKKTMVFYLHGLRGHAYAQKQALEHMVRHVGVSVVSLELPGHGADSVSEHCMVPAYMDIVADIKHEICQQSMHAEQVILMGYSFGSALMALASQALIDDASFKPKVVGFIGISSGFDVGHNVKPWKLRINGLVAPVSKFLFEHFRPLSRFVTIHGMTVSLISPDKSVQASIHDDDLVYKGRIPLFTSAQVYHAGLKGKKAVNELPIPVLLLHSKDDEIALAPSSDYFGSHVVLRLFEQLRHNCIDGLTREAVVARKAITRFIADKLL